MTHDVSSSSTARNYMQIVSMKNYYTIVHQYKLILLLKCQLNSSLNLPLRFTLKNNKVYQIITYKYVVHYILENILINKIKNGTNRNNIIVDPRVYHEQEYAFISCLLRWQRTVLVDYSDFKKSFIILIGRY